MLPRALRGEHQSTVPLEDIVGLPQQVRLEGTTALPHRETAACDLAVLMATGGGTIALHRDVTVLHLPDERTGTIPEGDECLPHLIHEDQCPCHLVRLPPVTGLQAAVVKPEGRGHLVIEEREGGLETGHPDTGAAVPQAGELYNRDCTQIIMC